MSTIKQDRKDLEMLLNGISPIERQAPTQDSSPNQVQPAPATNTVVDNAGAEIGVEKMFEYEPASMKKGLRKKARKTILTIAKHILTDDLLEEEYIQDKIEQDIDTLADLYMQLETNNIMQRALVMTVSRGNTAPRNFEVFGQLTDKISSVNKQIIDTEQKLRKTYLDLKFEIRDKQEEIAGLTGNVTPSLGTSMQQNTGVIITSSKDLINQVKKKHREALDLAKETTYTEEND